MPPRFVLLLLLHFFHWTKDAALGTLLTAGSLPGPFVVNASANASLEAGNLNLVFIKVR